ncbi:MAG: hypothetical protein IIY99_04435, partial [Firmicutes bacterium]|nr:hypothetical protein [Bacillota bacterium]
MEKKDKKSGKHGRGLDTIGKRILVLTIAILMTFQFCTPTFYGISFADEEEYLETEQPVDEQAVEPAETPDEEVQAEEPQGEATDPVLEEAVTEEPVDEVPADTADEQEEPAVSEEEEPVEPAAEEPVVEPADEEPQAEPAQDEQPAEPVQDEPTEEPQEEPAETVELNGDWMYFEKEVNGVNVFVTAEPDTFPVGTEMKVEAVSNAVVQDAVEEAMGGNVGDFRAVDITFYTEEESDIQPLKPVSVQMATNAFESEENLTVVHVEDAYENIAEVVELDEASSDDTTAVFDADGFSIYVVAETFADTYKFVVNGETVRTQKVVAGDYLYEPETPTDPNGDKFLGWFIGDEELVFASNGKYTVPSAS